MNIQFENQGTATYLVYKIMPDDDLDSMSLGMITNNKIPGLAPALFTQMDEDKYIKYNVSSKVTAKHFFEGQVNKKRLIGVFRGIIDAMIAAEEYMIDPNSIVLDMEYIFADVSTCETILICLPVNLLEKKPVDLGMFFKEIMFSTQFDQTENCDHVTKIINYLNSTRNFSVSSFRKLLEDIRLNQTAQAKPVNSVPQPAPVSTPPVAMTQPKAEQPAVNVVKPPVTPAKPNPIPQPNQASTGAQQGVYNAGVKKTINTPPVVQQSTVNQQMEDEKKVSLLDVLMHYNPENVKRYKEQKKKPEPASNSKSNTKTSYPVPGQTATPSYAVPGQPSKQSYPVPGQPTQATPAAQKNNLNANTANAGYNTQQKQVTQVQPASAQSIPVNVPETKKANFGDTTVLNNGTNNGGTTVLDPSMLQNVAPQGPYLHRLKNNEKIYITKPEFKIGKERSFVDYFVADNTAVSRSHATIITENGSYFIMDTNSTNHTYINGGMIQSNVKTRLEHDTKIRLANEEFEFKMY